MVRPSHYFDKVRLWALNNGKSAGLVDEQVAALLAPNVGDTLMVEFTTDATGHHFRVLINGKDDAVVSDAQKQQGNAAINYAGVMVNGNTANGIDYFFAARTIDSAPPGAVTDLAVVSASASSISLKWKAPGDDDNIGTAKSYDLRYSTAPVYDANFGSATPAGAVPTPATAGTVENATVSGLVNESAGLTINTNEFGEARVSWRLGPNAGPHTVRVTSDNLLASPFDFLATAEAGRAAQLAIYSGQNGVGEVGGNPPALCVLVTDASGNGVDGVEVMFELVRGTGTFSPGAIMPVIETTTRDGGFACATLTLGLDVGYRYVRATSSGLGGSPATFSVYGRALAAQSMKTIDRSNNQSGTKGKELNFPLQVLVQDRLGNPVVNYAVDFLITAGGGNFNGVTSFTAKTDSQGIAAAPWTLGSFATENEATVVRSGLLPSTLIFRATGFDNNFPIFADAPDRRMTEDDVIEFQVSATDADGEPLNYGAKNLPPGAQFDSLGAHVFFWATPPISAGQYEVSFLARDPRGGVDEELVIIEVKKRNRPPIIFSRIPAGNSNSSLPDTTLEIVNGVGTMLMRVNAVDPDGDELSYRWFVNGKYAGSATNTFFFRSADRFSNVEALVFDLEDTSRTQWVVQVPVELSGLSAVLESDVTGKTHVSLRWSTASETNHAGFNVLRSAGRNNSAERNYEKLNRQLIAPRRDGQYVFVDDDIEAGGRYFYKLQDLDLQGNITEHGPVSINVAAPQRYVLQQNYPNPFNPTTQIGYELPKAGQVSLIIHNSLGQEVRRLVDKHQAAGYHHVTWNGRDQSGKPVPSGIYHYRLQVGEFVATKRMLMTK